MCIGIKQNQDSSLIIHIIVHKKFHYARLYDKNESSIIELVKFNNNNTNKYMFSFDYTLLSIYNIFVRAKSNNDDNDNNKWWSCFISDG